MARKNDFAGSAGGPPVPTSSVPAPAGGVPDDLMQVVRGFQASRVVLSAVELDLFSALDRAAERAGDPPWARAEEVAVELNTDRRATETLMNALAALDLLRKTGDRFRNSGVAARCLSERGDDFARPALMHSVHLWTRWSTLTDCVKAGTSVTWTRMDERGDEWTHAFIAAMHRNASGRAPAVVEAVGAQGARRLLDVGGGSGAYAIAFARANPKLAAEVLDLAPVKPIAERHVREADLSDRVTVRVGDLRRDDLGRGYDLILLFAICHMLSPEENLDLLRRCYKASASGGRVVIQDFLLEPDKTAPRQAALFAINMLVGTRAGSSYSEPEYGRWLAEAGFDDIHRKDVPGPADLMVGVRKH